MPSSILVLNSGSSSLKFSLMDSTSQEVLLDGIAEKLGQPDASIHFRQPPDDMTLPLRPATHAAAVASLYAELRQRNLSPSIAGVGHRVVHGGERFKTSTLINDEVMAAIEACVPFAPLHNPANLTGIKGALEVAPHLPQVAVFDTAFHQTLPQKAFLYGVPMSWYRQWGIRRYGFHGTSHQYVTLCAAEMLGRPLSETAFISAHLGNGASAAAVYQGCSVDTTMGFTPLEGLVMGTRSGDIDPGLIPYIAASLGIRSDEVIPLLNQKSGLLGLSELSNDMRELSAAAESGHAGAQIAIEVFVFRLARAIGALSVSLPRLDALIFTGGIGENSALVREKVLRQLSIMGYQTDMDANLATVGGRGGIITQPGTPIAMVVNTNEEAMIAQQTIKVLQQNRITT